jgi:hypothetical protein
LGVFTADKLVARQMSHAGISVFEGSYSKDSLSKKKKKWNDCTVTINVDTRHVSVRDEEATNANVFSGSIDRIKLECLMKEMYSEVQIGSVVLQIHERISGNMNQSTNSAATGAITLHAPIRSQVLSTTSDLAVGSNRLPPSMSSILKPFKRPNQKLASATDSCFRAGALTPKQSASNGTTEVIEEIGDDENSQDSNINISFLDGTESSASRSTNMSPTPCAVSALCSVSAVPRPANRSLSGVTTATPHALMRSTVGVSGMFPILLPLCKYAQTTATARTAVQFQSPRQYTTLMAAAAGEELLFSLCTGMQYREERLRSVYAKHAKSGSTSGPSTSSKLLTSVINFNSQANSDFVEVSVNTHKSKAAEGGAVHSGKNSKLNKFNTSAKKRKWGKQDKEEDEEDIEESPKNTDVNNPEKTYMTIPKSSLDQYRGISTQLLCGCLDKAHIITGELALGKGDIWFLWQNTADVFNVEDICSVYGQAAKVGSKVGSSQRDLCESDATSKLDQFIADRAKYSYPYPWHGGILWQVYAYCYLTFDCKHWILMLCAHSALPS